MKKQKAPFKVLIAIVRREKTDFANKLLQQLGVCSLVTTFGLGVDRSGVLELLGLKNAECTVIFGLVDSTKTSFVLGVLEKELNFQNPDNGMAFTISLSAIAKNSLGVLVASCKLCSAERQEKEDNKNKQNIEVNEKLNKDIKQEKEKVENVSHKQKEQMLNNENFIQQPQKNINRQNKNNTANFEKEQTPSKQNALLKTKIEKKSTKKEAEK